MNVKTYWVDLANGNTKHYKIMEDDAVQAVLASVLRGELGVNHERVMLDRPSLGRPTIELVIRLQEKNEVGGRRFTLIYRAKTALYAVLLLNAAVWAYLAHWFYVWDAFVWIGAFLIIEMNINQWRDEIRDRLGLVAV